MKRTWWAALSAAAVLVVPASAGAADNSVIVKYKAGVAAKTRDDRGQPGGRRRAFLGSVAANGGGRPGGGRPGGGRGHAPRARRRSTSPSRTSICARSRCRTTRGSASLRAQQPPGGTDADMDAPEGWDAAGSAASRRPAAPRSASSTPASTEHRGPRGQDRACAPLRTRDPRRATACTDGTCTDQNDHGSHVAGTITANANNGVGVAGVSFNSPARDLQGAQRSSAPARPPASPTASPTSPARA